MESQPFCYAPFLQRNTHRRRYCIKCDNGFIENEEMDTHTYSRQAKRIKGRYRCSDCRYEAYNIKNMWSHCEEANHQTGSEQGINKETTRRYNTDPAYICRRCNKGFATKKSAALHKRNCYAKRNIKRTQTTKYTCKRCGKATILKSVALIHYRRCRKGIWTGGLQEEELGVKKINIELNIRNYDEQRITSSSFNHTSHIFTNIGAKQVKGMCSFQVEAQEQVDEEVPIIRDIYFTTPTEELHLLTYNEITSWWSQQLAQDIDEWTENGSGLVVTKIVRAYCTFITYNSRFGGYKKDLPNIFYNHRKVLNIINTPVEATDCLKLLH